MQVYCPECNTGYEINPALIPNEGKKLRCAKCDAVWLCTPNDFFDVDKKNQIDEVVTSFSPAEEDVSESENEFVLNAELSVKADEENKDDNSNDMQEIFARLSAQSESIYKAEKKIPIYKKIWKAVVKFFGLKNKMVCLSYILTFLILTALVLNYARYDIVRKFPSLEKAYNTFGIESRILGEGLEFQNINRRDFEEDFVNKTEVKGYVINTTDKDIYLPTIHLNMLDKNAQILQEVEIRLDDKKVIGGGQLAFRMVVTKPSPLSKYIYLTFVRDKK